MRFGAPPSHSSPSAVLLAPLTGPTGCCISAAHVAAGPAPVQHGSLEPQPWRKMRLQRSAPCATLHSDMHSCAAVPPHAAPMLSDVATSLSSMRPRSSSLGAEWGARGRSAGRPAARRPRGRRARGPGTARAARAQLSAAVTLCCGAGGGARCMPPPRVPGRELS
ncbi:MAG: hypothetical protein J3K34DRAFT_437846 [Monoraphidium minutum]|nr:MAG: hypothetical protein J3K34DRAFT_437846 [Monoraphidium minutum]